MTDLASDILTIEEAAQYLRIPLSTLYRLAQEGKVPCQKVGRHWRFHRQSLAHWIANADLSFEGKKQKKTDLDFL